MGSSPMLDAAPPQPPDVSGQQGQSPFSGVGAMLQKQGQGGPGAGGGAPGGVNPRGALVTMSDAIKKVLDQMAKMESGFSPFADRIRSLLDAGVGSVMSGGPPGSGSQSNAPSVMSPSQRPENPGGSGSFPG
jgi:hypothetical protein